MKKLAVLLISGLMSVTASAVNWILIADTPRMNYYIDIDSISSSGKYKTVFIKNIYAQPNAIAPSITIDQEMAFLRFDCNSTPQKVQLLSAYTYSGDKPVDYAGYDENVEWSVVYPGTVLANQASLVCSH